MPIPKSRRDSHYHEIELFSVGGIHCVFIDQPIFDTINSKIL